MTTPLTKKQFSILKFVRNFIEKNGYAPSFREIADKFKLSSLATVHQHLQALKQKGYISYTNGSSRSIIIIEQDEADDTSSIYEIPLVGLITAGQPIEAVEEKEKIEIPQILVPSKDKTFALRVKGDSMIEDGIHDGDVVIVKQQTTANNGDIVVALLENEYATLKRFYKEKGQFRLQPANRDYKPLIVKDLQIQGKVVGLMRRY